MDVGDLVNSLRAHSNSPELHGVIREDKVQRNIRPPSGIEQVGVECRPRTVIVEQVTTEWLAFTINLSGEV